MRQRSHSLLWFTAVFLVVLSGFADKGTADTMISGEVLAAVIALPAFAVFGGIFGPMFFNESLNLIKQKQEDVSGLLFLFTLKSYADVYTK